MFSSLLIANRGEIACRIIKTCQRLGIWTVAVHSEADAQARHVREADQAVCIGPARARDSYLNAQAVIDAALSTGAQAIHPGYGFLSERLDLIEACESAGIVFVGPHRDAIAAMGSKIESKRIARAAGVPCIPGYDGDDQSLERLQEEAERIGFPLLIKASAGGGGKGMRRVDHLQELQAQLVTARAEAKAAFGDDRVLLERYITRPRHVEVQLLGDKHGGLVHLFERECSIQRNYQKLIEEAPAPHLHQNVRQRLFEAALALGREIRYDSAGTVEFVLDADHDDEPYFLEVNTRLQVEHPVTELTTGLDLVEWQIRVAAGEPLAFGQAALKQTGWAIEARVNAESPADGFAPSFGRVRDYAEPQRQSVRIDSGIDAHSEVAPHYDSLVAKVIGYGSDRNVAQRRLVEGLKDLRIGGLQTTQPLLIDILGCEAFQSVLTTHFLGQHWPHGWHPAKALQQEAMAIAAVAWLHARRARSDDRPMAALTSWRTTANVDGLGRSHVEVDDGGNATPLSLRLSTEGAWWLCDGAERGLQRIDETTWRCQQHGPIFHTRSAGHSVEVWSDGWCGTFTVRSRVSVPAAQGASGSSADTIAADLPGVLSQILVAQGDVVTAGTPVAVLEAMKLFHTLHAPRDGVVRSLPVAVGATVAKGAALVELAAEGG